MEAKELKKKVTKGQEIDRETSFIIVYTLHKHKDMVILKKK